MVVITPDLTLYFIAASIYQFFDSIYQSWVQKIASIKMMLRIYAYAKQYWPLLLASNILMIISSSISVLTPKYSGKVIDLVSKSQDLNDLFAMIQRITFIHLFHSLIDIIKGFISARVQRNISQKIKADFYTNLLSKDIEFYDGKKVGEISSRLNNDISQAQNMSTEDLSSLLKHFYETIASIFVLYDMSPTLSMVILCVSIPKAIIIKRKGSYVRAHSKTVNDVRSKLNSTAVEVFSNIRVVKSFSTEQKEAQDYLTKAAELVGVQEQLQLNNSAISLLMTVIARVKHAILMYYGGSLVMNGTISPGELSSFLLYGNKLGNAFDWIKVIVEKYATSFAACERVFEIIDLKPKIDIDAKGGIKDVELKGEISFEKVSFAYPSKKNVKVMKNINISIDKGESVALVGSSGSGKSTFVSLLERFYDPENGVVKIDGRDIKAYDIKWLHQKIGYVAQEPSLFSGSIEENIKYDIENCSEEELKQAIRSANADFVFDKQQFPEGLQTIVGERGSKLSGGQKQRIAIARALIKNPKILIFDEATSALDAESEHQVQIAIDQLMKSEERTSIIIAHRLSTIRDCHRILVMEKGQVEESGSHHELIEKDGLYKKLMDRQLAGFESPPREVSQTPPDDVGVKAEKGGSFRRGGKMLGLEGENGEKKFKHSRRSKASNGDEDK